MRDDKLLGVREREQISAFGYAGRRGLTRGRAVTKLPRAKSCRGRTTVTAPLLPRVAEAAGGKEAAVEPSRQAAVEAEEAGSGVQAG